MRYFIKTFGCQMNKSDSERIATVLESINYCPASSLEEADLIVVNMCSVRQSAVDRVYGLIPKFQKLKSKNLKLKTILTGCILNQDRRKLESKFDYILSKQALNQWSDFLNQEQWVEPSSFSRKGWAQNASHPPQTAEASYYPDPRTKKFNQQYNAKYLDFTPKYKEQARAFIPISAGCDNFCSYCVVPYTRGPLNCRDHKQVIKEAKQVIKKGVKEIWLLGQNVNDYHSPINSSIDFPELLKAINKIEGNFWLRFTSPHPMNFSNRLINTMAKSKKVTPYLNLPLQSGDNKILKKMNRPYSIEQYKELVKEIREKIPNLSLSTDIIVGFPGENKKNFNNTVKLFKEIKFDMAYIAKYSPRPQTAASKLEDNISKKEKKRREKVLTKILKKQALEFNQQFIGNKMKIAVLDKNGKLIGKNKYHKTVQFQGSRDLIGKFAKVKILEAGPWGLTGRK